MNATRIITRAMMAIVTLFLVAGLAMGQNLNLNGAGGTLAGTYNVKGNINTTNATGVYTFSSTMNLNGTGTTLTQTIANGGGTNTAKAVVFANLNATGDKHKALGGIVTVSTAFVQNNSAGQDFVVGANTLNFAGTTTLTSGDFVASDAGSTVNYTSGGAQTVLASTYGGALGLSGGGAKSIGTGGVSAATMTHTGGPLTVGNALTLTGGATTLDAVSVSASTTLEYNGNITLSITTLSSNAGTVTTGAGAGQITFAQTSALTNDGTITTGGGTLVFSGNVTNSATKSLTVTGAGTAKFAGSVTNSGTFTFATNSTAEYNGTSGQTIAAPSAGEYHHLTLTGNNTKSASSNMAPGGTLTINGTSTLDMGGDANNYTLGAASYAGIATGATVKFGGSTHGTAIATGTVEYYGSIANQAIAAGSYRRIVLSGSGNKNVANSATVSTSGDLDVSSGVTLVVGTSANLNVGTTAGDLNIAGDITNNGTITVGS